MKANQAMSDPGADPILKTETVMMTIPIEKMHLSSNGISYLLSNCETTGRSGGHAPNGANPYVASPVKILATVA
jgi:hypothetical protein